MITKYSEVQDEYSRREYKKLRAEYHVTQEELAEQLGLSFQAISKWENEEVLPDILLLPEIAAFFEVSMDDLFKENMLTYATRADRLPAVYECTDKLEDFIKVKVEMEKQLEIQSTPELQRSYGVMWHSAVRSLAMRRTPQTTQPF